MTVVRARRPGLAVRARLATVSAVACAVSLAACGGVAAPRGNLFAEGRGVFERAGCGGCHTVASAHTHGRIGPDFDTSEQLTRDHIRTEVRFGEDAMPSFAGRISTEQEAAVVEFVYRTLRQHKPRGR
jgi:mono/diheme cytochrome c family protein